MAGVSAQLGSRTYALVPQRIGRIGRKLTAITTIASIAEGHGDDELADGVTDRLYDALQVFIPDLAPRYELAGYADEAGWRRVREHPKAVEAARDTYARHALASRTGADVADEHGERIPDDELAQVAGDVDAPDPWSLLTPAEQLAFEAPELDDPYDDAADRSPTPPEIVTVVEQIFEIHGGTRLVRLLKGIIGPDTIRPIVRAELLGWAQARSQNAQLRTGGAPSTPTTAPTETPAASPAETVDGVATELSQPTAPEPPASAA